MGVQINGDTGNVIATKGTFSGDVGIGGTLTYEDVTNIDAVGIITARSGIEIGARPGVAASVSVDGNAIFSGVTTVGGRIDTTDDTDGALNATFTRGSDTAFQLQFRNHRDGNSPRSGVGSFGVFRGDNDIVGLRFMRGIGADGAGALAVTQAGVEKVRVDYNGRVGIGTTIPAADLHVSSGSNTEIRIGDTTTTSSYGRIIYNNDADNADALVFEADGGNAISGSNIRFKIDGGEKARILSTGGITFNGDTATANALDDYEEGDWTPTYEAGSSSITVNAYSVQYGKYVKIGKMVYIEGGLRANVTNNSNGTYDLGGLPFTVANTTNASGIIHGKEQSSWTVAPDHFSCISNTTRARARGGLTVGDDAYTNANTSGFNSGSATNNSCLLYTSPSPRDY